MKLIYNEELGQFEITIPYRKGDHGSYPHSQTGKSKTIASTKGSMTLLDGPDPLKLNLILYHEIEDPRAWGPNLKLLKEEHKKKKKKKEEETDATE